MSKHEKLLRKVLDGQSDANIRFDDMRKLLQNLGFIERVRGSHHLFRRTDIAEKINLQRDDGLAKPYQVQQVRHVIFKYQLNESE